MYQSNPAARFPWERKVQDRREMLRVKLKSLAAEAKIIRHEQAKVPAGQLREELYLHRVTVVRSAARMTLLAYSMIRGRKYKQIEPRVSKENEEWWKNPQRKNELESLVAMYLRYSSPWQYWSKADEAKQREKVLEWLNAK